jgi:hypothetical protein
MAERPSAIWRRNKEEEAAELAAGTLDPDRAYMDRLFPDALLDATDAALSTFEREVGELRDASDDDVMGVVKRAVLALNAVNDQFGGAAYETDERELLCRYVDVTLGEAGIDVPALCDRRGLGRYAITDEWRRW